VASDAAQILVSILTHPVRWVRGHPGRRGDRRHVSILTHPVRWVRDHVRRGNERARGGVSILTHPVRWVRDPDGPPSVVSVSFNPHPPREVGASIEIAGPQHSPVVSILTHPVRWVRDDRVNVRVAVTVSILTHPVRWVRAGMTSPEAALLSFNPHPPREVGARPSPLALRHRHGVSILTLSIAPVNEPGIAGVFEPPVTLLMVSSSAHPRVAGEPAWRGSWGPR
jgi:hypothetical protein